LIIINESRSSMRYCRRSSAHAAARRIDCGEPSRAIELRRAVPALRSGVVEETTEVHDAPAYTEGESSMPMLKSSVVIGSIVVGMMMLLVSSSHAVVSGPQAATATTTAPATSIAWVCGPRRCVWRPGWHGFVPRWAVWGPPRLPGCFYEKRPIGWVEVCPL
jgi:hypothetical protein